MKRPMTLQHWMSRFRTTDQGGRLESDEKVRVRHNHAWLNLFSFGDMRCGLQTYQAPRSRQSHLAIPEALLAVVHFPISARGMRPD